MHPANAGDGAAYPRSTERDVCPRYCGVNSGWIRRVLIRRSAGAARAPENAEIVANAEGVFDHLERWGWAGPAFSAKLEGMLDQLSRPHHAEYHAGLDTLGACFGAHVTRTTAAGAPDVVWSFSDDHFTFEVKTEKTGPLSKGDLLEARGHVDWVKAQIAEDPKTARVVPLVVSPTTEVHEVGAPYTGDLFHLSPDEILTRARVVARVVSDLRIRFDEVVLRHVAADLALARPGPAREQRRAVQDDAEVTAAVLGRSHFRNEVQQKQQRAVAHSVPRTPLPSECC